MAATLHGGREGWEMDVNFEHPGFVEDHHRTQQRNNRDASTAAPRRMSSIQLVETLVARLLNNNQVRPQQGHEHETPATASLQGTYNSAFSLLPNNTNAISSAAPTRRQGREGGSDLSQDAWNKVAHSVDDPSTPSPPHVNLERPIDGNVSQEHATLEEEHYSSNSGTQSWCPVMHAASGPKRSLAQGEPWCRICYEGGNLVKLGCRCKNELSYAHEVRFNLP